VEVNRRASNRNQPDFLNNPQDDERSFLQDSHFERLHYVPYCINNTLRNV